MTKLELVKLPDDRFVDTQSGTHVLLIEVEGHQLPVMLDQEPDARLLSEVFKACATALDRLVARSK